MSFADPQFVTARFRLRPLTTEDVTCRYLAWLSGEGSDHIVSASSMQSLDDLRSYVASKSGRDDALFLGVFDLATGDHIGNLKYEPIDEQNGYTIFGILIGDVDSRGKGVAREIIEPTGRWLKVNRKIDQVVLGVSLDNPPAIRAYEKIGFRFERTPFYTETPKCVSMIWRP